MTAPASSPSSSSEQPQPVRLAEYNGVCGSCHRGIRIGDVIRKPPGRAWRHDDCAQPRGRSW